jgi:hypothetical protein
MDNTIRTFKEVFPDVNTELTLEQIHFAQGGEWRLDHRNRHPFNNWEDDDVPCLFCKDVYCAGCKPA